jgi:hypothetical protein
VNKIDVIKSRVIELDTSDLSKTDIGVNIKAIVPVSGVPLPATLGVDDALKKLKSSEIKLVKFSVMNNDMMKAANNSPEKIQYLINWGNDARIAIEVFMAMDATLATKFDNDASLTLSAGVDKVVKATVGVGGSSSGGTTVQMTNMGFAYLLAKIDWDAHERRTRPGSSTSTTISGASAECSCPSGGRAFPDRPCLRRETGPFRFRASCAAARYS